MAGHVWTRETAAERIDAYLAEVDAVTIKPYVRDTDLANLPRNTAYRVDGAHVYIDILNLKEMLASTVQEGVTCHRRTLRFLNLHYRAVRRIVQHADAIEVDFHNQRLHAVVAKPYGDEAKRIHRAVALAQLVIDVLGRIGEETEDDTIPPARVRAGIDTGIALAVNNGRRGHREPLFLGEPANRAAKRAAGGTATGIYLTNTARQAIDLPSVKNEDTAALSLDEVATSQRKANLDVTSDDIVESWLDDYNANPIGRFTFSGHTPPFADLDFEALSPQNSRRQNAVSLYADLDGFTAFIAAHVADDDGAKDVVRVLHVLRSEMDAVLHADFQGRKVRFIGDCIHGVIVEGTALTTDEEDTLRTAVLCSGALRSSFELALDTLDAEGLGVDGLGLAIGFEFGPVALTRLGIKGGKIRCAVGRGVLASEREQQRCSGSETAIGSVAHGGATLAATLFGATRKRSGLDYDAAVAALKDADARAAKGVREAGVVDTGLLRPATAASAPFAFPNRSAAPTKPAGFA
ncbi:MAG: adenylate/guanylate cyclase domain-containing protein [Vicinamibacterales bacterium]